MRSKQLEAWLSPTKDFNDFWLSGTGVILPNSGPLESGLERAGGGGLNEAGETHQPRNVARETQELRGWEIWWKRSERMSGVNGLPIFASSRMELCQMCGLFGEGGGLAGELAILRALAVQASDDRAICP